MGWGERDPPNSPWPLCRVYDVKVTSRRRRRRKRRRRRRRRTKRSEVCLQRAFGGGGAIVTTQQRRCRRPSSRAPPLARPGQSTRLLGWGRRGRHSNQQRVHWLHLTITRAISARLGALLEAVGGGRVTA
eukprot:gene10049-biopygen6251